MEARPHPPVTVTSPAPPNPDFPGPSVSPVSHFRLGMNSEAMKSEYSNSIDPARSTFSSSSGLHVGPVTTTATAATPTTALPPIRSPRSTVVPLDAVPGLVYSGKKKSVSFFGGLFDRARGSLGGSSTSLHKVHASLSVSTGASTSSLFSGLTGTPSPRRETNLIRDSNANIQEKDISPTGMSSRADPGSVFPSTSDAGDGFAERDADGTPRRHYDNANAKHVEALPLGATSSSELVKRVSLSSVPSGRIAQINRSLSRRDSHGTSGGGDRVSLGVVSGAARSTTSRRSRWAGFKDFISTRFGGTRSTDDDATGDEYPEAYDEFYDLMQRMVDERAAEPDLDYTNEQLRYFRQRKYMEDFYSSDSLSENDGSEEGNHHDGPSLDSDDESSYSVVSSGDVRLDTVSLASRIRRRRRERLSRQGKSPSRQRSTSSQSGADSSVTGSQKFHDSGSEASDSDDQHRSSTTSHRSSRRRRLLHHPPHQPRGSSVSVDGANGAFDTASFVGDVGSPFSQTSSMPASVVFNIPTSESTGAIRRPEPPAVGRTPDSRSKRRQPSPVRSHSTATSPFRGSTVNEDDFYNVGGINDFLSDEDLVNSDGGLEDDDMDSVGTGATEDEIRDRLSFMYDPKIDDARRKMINTAKVVQSSERGRDYMKDFDGEIRSDALMLSEIRLNSVEEQEKHVDDERTTKFSRLWKDHNDYVSGLVARERQSMREVRTSFQDREKSHAEKHNQRKTQFGRAIKIMDRLFQRSRKQLLNVLSVRRKNVRSHYGHLIDADDRYGDFGTHARHNWSSSARSVKIRLVMLRAIKDKLPPGQYMLVCSVYERLGGARLEWARSAARAFSLCPLHDRRVSGCDCCSGLVGYTLPFNHGGQFSDIELLVNQSLYTTCPSKEDMKPYMCFVFELVMLTAIRSTGGVLPAAATSTSGGFQFASILSGTRQRGTGHRQRWRQKVVGWGIFPMLDPKFDVIRGRCKTPMIRGPVDLGVDSYSKFESLYRDDLDVWLGNLYFEALPQPRMKRQFDPLRLKKKLLKENDIETGFTSQMLRLNTSRRDEESEGGDSAASDTRNTDDDDTSEDGADVGIDDSRMQNILEGGVGGGGGGSGSIGGPNLLNDFGAGMRSGVGGSIVAPINRTGFGAGTLRSHISVDSLNPGSRPSPSPTNAAMTGSPRQIPLSGGSSPLLRTTTLPSPHSAHPLQLEEQSGGSGWPPTTQLPPPQLGRSESDRLLRRVLKQRAPDSPVFSGAGGVTAAMLFADTDGGSTGPGAASVQNSRTTALPPPALVPTMSSTTVLSDTAIVGGSGADSARYRHIMARHRSSSQSLIDYMGAPGGVSGGLEGAISGPFGTHASVPTAGLPTYTTTTTTTGITAAELPDAILRSEVVTKFLQTDSRTAMQRAHAKVYRKRLPVKDGVVGYDHNIDDWMDFSDEDRSVVKPSPPSSGLAASHGAAGLHRRTQFRTQQSTKARRLEQYRFDIRQPRGYREKRESLQKFSYLRRALGADLGTVDKMSLEFWGVVLLFAVSVYMALFLHYLGQYIFLRFYGIQVDQYEILPYRIDLSYQADLIPLWVEFAVTTFGPLANLLILFLLIGIAWWSQVVLGGFIDYGFRFIMVFGLATVLDPYVVLVIDIISGNTDRGDVFKVRSALERRENADSSMGLFLMGVLYAWISVVSMFVVYAYFMRIHMNGVVIDVFHRLHADRRSYLVPFDMEISLAELDHVCRTAEMWRGANGERRKVLVLEYIMTDPDDLKFNESTMHVIIYEINPEDQTRRIHRQFLRLATGVLTELALDVSSLGSMEYSALSKAFNVRSLADIVQGTVAVTDVKPVSSGYSLQQLLTVNKARLKFLHLTGKTPRKSTAT